MSRSSPRLKEALILHGGSMKASTKTILGAELLPEHYTQSTPPAFGQAHADDFHFRRKIALQDVRGGMKMQRGGDQINQRRGWLEFQAREITVTRKVSLGLMPADARPIVRGLHRQIHVLRGFEFQNR